MNIKAIQTVITLSDGKSISLQWDQPEGDNWTAPTLVNSSQRPLEFPAEHQIGERPSVDKMREMFPVWARVSDLVISIKEKYSMNDQQIATIVGSDKRWHWMQPSPEGIKALSKKLYSDKHDAKGDFRPVSICRESKLIVMEQILSNLA